MQSEEGLQGYFGLSVLTAVSETSFKEVFLENTRHTYLL